MFVKPASPAASRSRYTRLLSPTAPAKLPSTERSSTTRHAPVFAPTALVSTATSSSRKHGREQARGLGGRPRGRATVTPTSVFLHAEGKRKLDCLTGTAR